MLSCLLALHSCSIKFNTSQLITGLRIHKCRIHSPLQAEKQDAVLLFAFSRRCLWVTSSVIRDPPEKIFQITNFWCLLFQQCFAMEQIKYILIYIYNLYIYIYYIYRKNMSDRANNSCLEKQNDSHIATTVFSS